MFNIVYPYPAFKKKIRFTTSQIDAFNQEFRQLKLKNQLQIYPISDEALAGLNAVNDFNFYGKHTYRY